MSAPRGTGELLVIYMNMGLSNRFLENKYNITAEKEGV